MRRNAGLTVVELLVALAVLAVLVGAGWPAMRQLVEQQRVNTALLLVRTAFASARMAAITSRSVVTLCPARGADACADGGDWNRDWLMFRSPVRASQPEDADAVLRRLPRPGHATIFLRGSAGRRALHYLPDGRSSGSNLRLHVCMKGHARGEVVVNNAGRIRSRRLPGTAACPE